MDKSKLAMHEKALNLARRFSVQNENDFLQVSTKAPGRGAVDGVALFPSEQPAYKPFIISLIFSCSFLTPCFARKTSWVSVRGTVGMSIPTELCGVIPSAQFLTPCFGFHL
jgi:hypothetical protein